MKAALFYPQPKLNDFVNAKWFGAVGDGNTDDTTALVAALSTGKSVVLPSGVYKTTSGLTMQTRGQRLVGNGSLLKPYGNFDVLTLTGGAEFMGFSGIYFFSANMTGGWQVKISNASRVEIEDVEMTSPFNGIYVESSNVCRIRDLWMNGARGTNCIKWYGDAGKRSDILLLSGVNLSGDTTARPTGIEWDGNCNTLQVTNVTAVNCGYGIRVRNTSGGPDPAFGMIHDLEIDFPSLDGASIETGNYIYFTTPYIHGSTTGSGLKVAAAVPANGVVISGGKVTSHNRYGIENVNPVRGMNLNMSNNVLGDISGSLKVTSPRFEMDGNAYIQVSGNTPYFNFDANDYMSFDRASNVASFNVNGATRFSISDVRSSSEVPLRIPSFTVSTLPDPIVHARSMIFVSDGANNKKLAISDGAAWRWQDGTVVS